MYNFNLDTFLYFARIRHLKGTFRSSALYGISEQHDPCIALITVHDGELLSCTMYNRYSRQIENTNASSEVLRRTTVLWTFDATAHEQSNAAFHDTFTPLPDLGRPEAVRASSSQLRRHSSPQLGHASLPQLEHQSAPALNYAVRPEQPVTPPPASGIRNSPHSDRLRSDAFARPSGVRAQLPSAGLSSTESLNGSASHLLESFATAVPHRLTVIPGSEILKWQGSAKGIYMRTNGINTIGQIALMLSLTVNDVLQVVLQLEKDEIITLERPL